MTASDYIDAAASAFSKADHFKEPEKARLCVAEAQVSALQAIAAAVDRLAAVEDSQR